MEDVNSLEIKTQERVLHEVFQKKLNYIYLGNFKDRENNSNIEEELLYKYLIKHYSDEYVRKAISEFKRIAHDESKELFEINKNVYSVLKYGIPISLNVDENKKTINLIDYSNPENNDFYVAEEVTVKGNFTKRPDIVVYINGIAIGVIELKRSTVSINEGIRQNLDNQQDLFIKKFFTTIQFVIAGNNSEGSKYATILTPANYFMQWKEDNAQGIGDIHEEVKSIINPSDYKMDIQLTSLFYKKRITDLINNFIIFDGGIKKVPRYNQYFGVSNAREFAKNHHDGIFWHTQGSGKSLSMVWLAKWILSNIDNSRILVFTDRRELDKQIKNVFTNAGEAKIHRTTSIEDLMECLETPSKGNLICSLIHKVGRSYDEDSDKEYADYVIELERRKTNLTVQGNFFVFVDECHRTQAGQLHDEMKKILPNAVFFGFTGTPLLKKNKKTTLEQFGGKYIHTYKFNEAVDDGVVVDLCYESRNVNQYIGNEDKIDAWFEEKTEGLNEIAKEKLKERWATLQNVTSSSERLEEIVKDIIMDFERIPRLKECKGSAFLVASSIYEACRYWEIFQSKGFKECAVISSYTPTMYEIRGEETGENILSDKQKVFDIYNQMWDKEKYPKLRAENEYDDKSSCFEEDSIDKFINEPARMKLLIVVDRLLAGFDAPDATYMYIDKQMQDHGLFQAICRVNRLDKEKDYGYIVDYKDLFNKIESAVDDYTGGAFADYSEEDVTGLLKDRLELGKEKLNKALEDVVNLCEPVNPPKAEIDYLHYFVNEELDDEDSLKNTEPRRLELYDKVAKLVRAYINIADEMTKAGYSQEEKNIIKQKVELYNNVRDIIMKAAGDYVELKNYDGAMRYMIDNYLKADDSELQFKLEGEEGATLLDIINASGLDNAVEKLPTGIRKNPQNIALAIENNIAHSIIVKNQENPRYYSKMSELLNELIKLKKEQNIDYQEYLKKLVELVKQVQNPEKSGYYPSQINNVRLRGLYDIFDKDENITEQLYERLNREIPNDFMSNVMIQRKVKTIISEYEKDDNKIEEIFNLWKNTRGY